LLSSSFCVEEADRFYFALDKATRSRTIKMSREWFLTGEPG